MSENTTTIASIVTVSQKEAVPVTASPFEPLFNTKEWAHNVEIVFLLLVIAIGVPGNLLLVIIQAKNKKRTSTDYLLMIMALYELFCCCWNAPMKLANKVPYLNINLLGTTFRCRINLFFLNFTGLGAAQMLAAIAADRYLKMCWPLNTFYGEKQAFIISGVIVLTSFALSLPHVAFIEWSDALKNCLMIMDAFISPSAYGRYLNIVFFTVFFIVAFSYINIHVSLKLRYRKKKRTRRRQGSGRFDSTVETTNISEETSVACTRITNDNPSHTSVVGPPAAEGDATVPRQDASKTDNVHSTKQEMGHCDYCKDGRNPVDGSSINIDEIEINSVGEKAQTSRPSEIGNTNDGRKSKSLASINVKAGQSERSMSHAKASYSRGDDSRSPDSVNTRQSNEARTLNRLTITMALISLIYVITGLINWMCFFLAPGAIDLSWVHLSFSLPLVNCITNPILLFTMSERFKNAAKKIICRR